MAERDDERINAFWDSLVARQPEVSGQESWQSSAIEHLHTRYAVSPPASTRDRVRQRVLDQHAVITTEDVMSVGAVALPLPYSNGHTMPKRTSWLPDRGARGHQRRWALASLAAAMVLVLAGIGSYFAFFENGAQQPAVIPAVIQESTPSTDVPMYRGNPARTGEMPGPGPEGDPIELWSFKAGGSINTAPAIVGNTLIAGSNDGYIYALDTASGGELWRVDTGAPANSSPAVENGIVYAGSGSGLLALDLETGEEIWRLSAILSAPTPAVTGGVIYVGSDDGNLYALDAATGDELWQAPLGAPATQAASMDAGIVYIGSRDGVLHAVAADTGAELWTLETGADPFITAVSNGVAYQGTVSDGNTFYALDAATGEEIWRLDKAELLRIPADSGDTLYIPSEAGELLAVDTATGDELWSFTTGAPIGAAPAVVGDTVYVCARQGICYALDASSGDELWQLQMDNSVEFGPVVSGGVLYVGTNAGTIYAIGGSDDPPVTAVDAGSIATPGNESDAGVTASPTATLDAAAIELVWESQLGASAEPLGIAVDQAGNLHVADSSVNQIHIFGPDGEFIESWGEPGTGPGQFRFRAGGTYNGELDFDADGNIYVFDFTNHRIQKFDAGRNFLTEWGTAGAGNGQFAFLSGSVDRANERIYVADLENNRIQVFDLDGNFLDKWGSFGTLNGQFFVPICVVAGPDGTVYVGEAGSRVQAFDQSGTFLFGFGGAGSDPGEFGEVQGLAIDANGNLFASDFTNGRIQVFRPDGTLIGIIKEIPGAGALVGPVGLAFDAEGYLYVADERTSRVLKLKLPPI